jgi:benzoyl-CoA reductase/2-hydroxyglutaryl-CoA dehydratase subunit BcrC/BadD/HgdB
LVLIKESHPVNADAAGILKWHYENRAATAIQKYKSGVPVIGYTSNTVPWELVRAAGFFPVLISSPAGGAPNPDPLPEPVLNYGARIIFDSIVAGDWSFLKLLIIPRTSEPEYKLYLYLCEMGRLGLNRKIPPLHLYDMLHTRSDRSLAYGLARTRELKQHLEEIAGHNFGREDLTNAVNESNMARAAIRAILQLRTGSKPQVSGSEAMELIGAWNFMERSEYADLATKALDALRKRAPIEGPRLVVKGVPLDHPRLHRAVEAHGAVVVAEDDWWGSRSAGCNIFPGEDLLDCIFRKYYFDAPSPRVFPFESADAWFKDQALNSIDGVIFYLPPDDNVFGWDYPRQRDFLEDNGIPSLLIREDAGEQDVSADLHGRLESFVRGLSRRE